MLEVYDVLSKLMMIQSSGEMMQLMIGSGDVERMKQNLGAIMQQKV